MSPAARKPPTATTLPTRPAPLATPAATDRAVARAVERWFAGNARELPWRPIGSARDPYHALVSEAMLQQTQVSRVVGYFLAFLGKFPTVHALAAADEGTVLGAWSGLGYYRRARSLHAAARVVVSEFGGEFPRTAAELRRLPGVGPYTAGAIASIVFNEAAPIVDGNVSRVLLRLANRPARHADPSQPATQRWVWKRAGELVGAATDPGAFNEGLMELGATVCTPRSPRCEVCPLRKDCGARIAGTQERIPRPKAAARTRALYCASVIGAGGPRGKVLVEQRSGVGASGAMWAGMWQAPTLERDDRAPTAEEVAELVGVAPDRVTPAGSFVHKTTHRTVHFEVWAAAFGRRRPRRGVWLPAASVETLGLSNPQRRILFGWGGEDGR